MLARSQWVWKGLHSVNGTHHLLTACALTPPPVGSRCHQSSAVAGHQWAESSSVFHPIFSRSQEFSCWLLERRLCFLTGLEVLKAHSQAVTTEIHLAKETEGPLGDWLVKLGMMSVVLCRASQLYPHGWLALGAPDRLMEIKEPELG